MSFKALLPFPQLLMCLLLCNLAQAQPLPPPSRTVFKCDEGGQVVYSDRPCLGAKKIEVEPTRGVSRLSGRERVGSDVQREVFRENMAEALRPATGMNPRQFETLGRRQPLAPAARQACRQLDEQIPPLERAELRASGQDLAAVQQRLFSLRSRFRELGC